MKLNSEIRMLKKWLDNNTDLPFFSDLKLKKLGFTFVGSNIYRYALILNKLSKYLNSNKINKCIDFGFYDYEIMDEMYNLLEEFQIDKVISERYLTKVRLVLNTKNHLF